MKIVDIHVHVFKNVSSIIDGMPASSTSYGMVKVGNKEMPFLQPWFENSCSKYEVYLKFMQQLNISKAILMSNPFYGYHNDYFIEAINKYPDKFKGVAYVDPLKGEKAAIELEQIYKRTPLFGFKVEVNTTFQCNRTGRISDDNFSPIFEVLEYYNQPFFIHPARQIDLDDIYNLSKKYSINFIICHMGAEANFGGGNYNKERFDILLKFAKENDNIFLDTSSVPFFFKEEYPFKTSSEIIEHAYSVIGGDKIMFSSDYPGMCNMATLEQLINLVVRHCDKIPPYDLEKIMGLNALNLFF